MRKPHVRRSGLYNTLQDLKRTLSPSVVKDEGWRNNVIPFQVKGIFRNTSLYGERLLQADTFIAEQNSPNWISR